MRGIRRSKQHTALTDLLVAKNPKTGHAVFPSKKALQCYAAVLGFEMGQRIPLPKGEVDSIEWHTFDNDAYTDYIYLVALGETKNLDVLRYDVGASEADGFNQDMVEIFEEYSNGGFEILSNWLLKTPSDPHGAKAIVSGLQRNDLLSSNKSEDKEQTFEKVDF